MTQFSPFAGQMSPRPEGKVICGRYDVIVTCQTPGAWALLTRVLTHAESSHGMFGMVTAVVE